MRTTLLALTFMAVSIVWWPTAAAVAQDARVARGTIAAIGGQSLTVKVGDHNMTFGIDSKTFVEARGASTKSGRAAATGKPGVHLDDLLQAGQAVAVTYNDMAGTLHATEIKAIQRADAPNASANRALRSSGVVTSIGQDSITINGRSGGGASFEQTFTVDHGTKVFAKGGSTAAAAKGGKVPFSEIIAGGDHVSVAYHRMGNALVASDVRVTMKKSQ